MSGRSILASASVPNRVLCQAEPPRCHVTIPDGALPIRDDVIPEHTRSMAGGASRDREAY